MNKKTEEFLILMKNNFFKINRNLSSEIKNLKIQSMITNNFKLNI